MATSPAHRSTRSMSTNNNLQTPSPGPRPRRMTSPSQGALNIPEGSHPPAQFGRPPSPLRNGFVPDTGTGINPHDVNSDSASDDDDDDDNDTHAGRWNNRSPSPAPSSSSVSQFAANIAQRVGSLVEGITSRSHLPTDEELEAEAQRERDRSRREAEAILTREAQQRRLVEGRVLAMMDQHHPLPPPPPISSSNPPSPSASQKERGDGLSWWTAAKNRLTPTKDPLTPAQQVIHETKVREKEQKKNVKGKEKASADWPSNPQSKLTDPALQNLNLPPPVSPQRKPVPRSQTPSPSPTPSRPAMSNMALNLTPSPMRSVDNLSTSPSRDAPPVYAQFNDQGTLDVHSTLLTIARRFEKLEKWTVGHVRALEERMNDVERWLVDKEKEREQKEKEKFASSSHNSETQSELTDIRDEISELQGRVGELGREMAKMIISPSNLSSGPSLHSPMISSASPTNSLMAATHYHHSPSASMPTMSSMISTPVHTRLVSSTARESTSPPMASGSGGTSGGRMSGTKLPYPTGDYTSPNNTGTFSPPSSPPPGNKARPITISGLPTTSTNSIAAASITRALSPTSSLTNLSATNLSLTNLGRVESPKPSINSFSTSKTSPNLPPPQPDPQQKKRQNSVSPTPRKRYTVALGEPIRSQSPSSSVSGGAGREKEFGDNDLTPGPKVGGKRGGGGGGGGGGMIETAVFSGASGTVEGEGDMFEEETIGKSAALRLVNSSGGSGGLDTGDVFSSNQALSLSANTNANTSQKTPRRPRPQSTYTFGSGSTAFDFSSLPPTAGGGPPQAKIQPLKPRIRSKSTDRFGSTDSLSSVSSTSTTSNTSIGGKFVDPLLLRKQEKEKEEKELRGRGQGVKGAKGRGKVAVGQLVAFFDEKKGEGKG